jgi:hypothetical protein
MTMDKQTVIECCNRVADVHDLPFYSELIDALQKAQKALMYSTPDAVQYPEPRARHDAALREVNSVLVRFNQTK